MNRLVVTRGEQRCWKLYEVVLTFTQVCIIRGPDQVCILVRFLSIQWMVPCLRRRQWAANRVFFLAVSWAGAWLYQRQQGLRARSLTYIA